MKRNQPNTRTTENVVRSKLFWDDPMPLQQAMAPGPFVGRERSFFADGFGSSFPAYLMIQNCNRTGLSSEPRISSAPYWEDQLQDATFRNGIRGREQGFRKAGQWLTKKVGQNAKIRFFIRFWTAPEGSTFVPKGTSTTIQPTRGVLVRHGARLSSRGQTFETFGVANPSRKIEKQRNTLSLSTRAIIPG